MLRTITPSEMKRVETRVMQETALTGEALMQNAAAHVARAVCRQAAGRAGQVVCLCGTGNNGGDGLAAMRILMEENPAFRGECWLLPGRLSADAQRELDRLTEAAGSPPHVAVHRVEGDFAMPEKVAWRNRRAVRAQACRARWRARRARPARRSKRWRRRACPWWRWTFRRG